MPISTFDNYNKVNGLQLKVSSSNNQPPSPQQPQRVNNGYLLIVIVFILNLSSSNHQVSCRGGAITRGSGGARGPHRRYNENEETDTLGVVLVVILPVAQMIAVLTIIVLLRICYRRYCSPNSINNHTIRNHKTLFGPTSPSSSSFLSSLTPPPPPPQASIMNATTNHQPSKY